jgi:hypothetical protein
MQAGDLDTHFLDAFFERVPPATPGDSELAKAVTQQRKPTPKMTVNSAWRQNR